MKKILIVDDMINTRFVIAQALKTEGYDVVEAENGADGVQMALEEKPDLIILDISMPKMDGYKVLEIIRGNPDVENIPVFISSAKVEVKEDFKDKDIQGFLAKPYKIDSLLAEINGYFS